MNYSHEYNGAIVLVGKTIDFNVEGPTGLKFDPYI